MPLICPTCQTRGRPIHGLAGGAFPDAGNSADPAEFGRPRMYKDLRTG